MTASEKRLLRLLLIIVLGYAVPFEILPFMVEFCKNYYHKIEQLQADIERNQRLVVNSDYWRTQFEQINKEREQTEGGLLQGESQQILGARIQQLLRDTAKQTASVITSMEPPSFENSKDNRWTLVTQTLQLDIPGPMLLNFLKLLQSGRETLFITSLDIRAGRDNKLAVKLKVSGFSHASSAPTENKPTG